MADYCARTDVEEKFGATNVATWADLDADQDAGKITSRIAACITKASEDVDARLYQGPYDLPFDATPDTPSIIEDIAAALAGVLLYESRGIADFNPETGAPMNKLGFHRTNAFKRLRQLRLGVLVIAEFSDDLPLTAPEVVMEDEDDADEEDIFHRTL